MKTIPMIAAAALLGASANLLAGEDSTDHWGAGGTGPAFYQTSCGLEDFTGPSADTPQPCTISGKHYQTTNDGRVPMHMVSAPGGLQFTAGSMAANDGHGGRKRSESRK